MGMGISRRGWLRCLLGGLLGPWLVHLGRGAASTAVGASAHSPATAAADLGGCVMTYTYDAGAFSAHSALALPAGLATTAVYDCVPPRPGAADTVG
jgi:hypothetical protein